MEARDEALVRCARLLRAAGRAAEADRILQEAVREAEGSGDRDPPRRALVMLAFYYEQTSRTAELGAVCRRLATSGPPC